MHTWSLTISSSLKSALRYWLLAPIVGGVFLYYLWTAWAPSRGFDPRANIYNYYNQLTDSFLAGKLHLLTAPTPQILALPNPYASVPLKARWGLWDASLYKGKYYLYFGASPVITLYLPYRLLAGRELSDYLASLIYLSGGFLWAVLSLIHLRDRYFKEAPSWMLALAVCVLGLADTAPFMLRRLAEYQVAIAGGYFFLAGGLYWLIRASESVRDEWGYLTGSLFLGLAVGARPNLGPAAAGILLLTGFGGIRRMGIRKEQMFSSLTALTLPFGICLLLIGTYNYLRFDSPLVFGNRYILTVADCHEGCFGVANIIPNLYFYLFHPLTINSTFPFLHLSALHHPFKVLPPNFYIEKIAGILHTVPYLLVGLLGVNIHRWRSKDNCSPTHGPSPTLKDQARYLVLTVGLTNFFILMLFYSSNMRYTTDFIPYLILSASLVWFRTDQLLHSRPTAQMLIRVLVICLAMISIVNGAAFGIEGSEYDPRSGLAGQDPETFRRLASFFEPISRAMQLVKRAFLL